MQSRVVLSAVLLSVAVPAWAQQTLDVQVPDATRHQMQVFERNLRLAIERGGQLLADRARQVVPDVELRFEVEPIVASVLVPEYGPIFYAQIPNIQEVGLKLWTINRQAQPATPLPRVSNTPPGGRVTAGGGAIADDPVVPPLTDPDKEYTAFMRGALIDAILDNALALPLAENETLTLIAGDIMGQPMNPFARPSRKLILRIKGEDLLALRQNRISRDEARARIKESKY